ncbi:MAG: hypothetical protein P1V51_19575 [Deltaproteobacteria bacterium]|nr:hypothetical protein [Deltaproteobacteria bacterium]
MRSLLLLLLLLVATACGATSTIHSSGSDDAGARDAGPDGGVDGGLDGGLDGGFDGGPDGGQIQCLGRDFCGCWQEPSCRFVSEGCLCPCDYQCPGEDPCDCGCGGGPYLGCQAAACPYVECQPGEILERDAEGCGVCVPSRDCSDLGFCDCEAVARCVSVTNIGHCDCGYGCNPEDPICDCAPPPFEPSYAGCVDVACPDPGCDTSVEMFVVGADGCAACAPRPDLP